jgi:hypothetical protein
MTGQAMSLVEAIVALTLSVERCVIPISGSLQLPFRKSVPPKKVFAPPPHGI